MNSLKIFLLVGIACLAVCGLVLAFEVPNANLNNDDITDFTDFSILANNWQQTGAGLAGDFDDSNTVDIDDLAIFSWYWLAEYSEYQQCQGIGTDLDNDGIIAFEDVAVVAQNWLSTGAGLAGDFDDSNSVDCNDLYIMADCWLEGTRPLGIWEQLKAALAAGDVNEALTFLADVSKDRYTEIFEALGENLQDFANGMGDLTLSSQESIKAKYEMLHQDGGQTYSFPVVFIRDDDGNWRIYNF